MNTRRHDMPFGAAVLEDGRVRFRLWAPGAKRVELTLRGPAPESTLESTLEMAVEAEGWFGLTTAAAAAGTRYQFRIDGDLHVPDPASRFQPQDVHGASQVVDPRRFAWQDSAWPGRPWEEAVIYELHVGTFSPEGTFAGLTQRLDALRELGVTAVELMPLADFPGARNWGYDGVLPFAPDSRYGSPEQLKELVQAAHARGLMVFLDVVYNHFGPEGNYLHVYAPQFFTEHHHTPWGAAINFDDRHSETVRRFFIHNALYWIEEYGFDGLRLDAVHAIADDSSPDILQDLATAVREGPGRERHVHLVLENDDNAAHYLQRQPDGHPRWYVAQWNDDIHHALHVATTGQTSGYYADYANAPIAQLARCLTEGFAYQGEPSPFRDGAPRGEPSAGLPASAFVNFIQNHDQVGNRALGERLGALTSPEALRAATALVLLAPSPPLLFMGQEWGADEPFLFFCAFGEDLAGKVTEGRRREFEKFPEFTAPQARERIPDPNALDTFERSRLDWPARTRPPHAAWLAFHRELLQVRHEHVIPTVKQAPQGSAEARLLAPRALHASWAYGQATLHLLANLGDTPAKAAPPGVPRYATGNHVADALGQGTLPAWSVAFFRS